MPAAVAVWRHSTHSPHATIPRVFHIRNPLALVVEKLYMDVHDGAVDDDDGREWGRDKGVFGQASLNFKYVRPIERNV